MLRLEHVCVRWSLSVCGGCVCGCVCVRERERERGEREREMDTTRKSAASGAPVLPTNGALQVRH